MDMGHREEAFFSFSFNGRINASSAYSFSAFQSVQIERMICSVEVLMEYRYICA